MPVVSILGRERFYRVVGEGEPLLLISGLGSDHTAWGYQVQAFRSNYRCIVFDNLGYSENQEPGEQLSVARMSEYAALLLDAIGITSTHVFGTSMGSAIAMELAIRHQEKVRTLALNAAWTRPTPYLARYLELMLSIAQSTPDETIALKNLRQMLFLISFSPDYLIGQPNDAAQAMKAALSSRQQLPGFVTQLRACLGHDVTGRLGNVRVPVLVSYGERDVLTPPEFGLRIHEMLPGSGFVVIPGAGHAALIEKPMEYNLVHQEFLARNAGQA